MTGLLLLLIAGLWLAASLSISRLLATRLAPKSLQAPAAGLLFIGLLLFPLADEIVGGFQFRSLCASSASFQVGVANPEGRTTRVAINPSHQPVSGTAIPILHSRIEYLDVNSGEHVVSFDEYVAKGGLLIRGLGISQDNSPLTLDKPYCSPQKGVNVRLTMKFHVVN